jgi:hypothetical protein
MFNCKLYSTIVHTCYLYYILIHSVLFYCTSCCVAFCYVLFCSINSTLQSAQSILACIPPLILLLSFGNPPGDSHRCHSAPKGTHCHLSPSSPAESTSLSTQHAAYRGSGIARLASLYCPQSYTEQGTRTSDARRAMPDPR